MQSHGENGRLAPTIAAAKRPRVWVDIKRGRPGNSLRQAFRRRPLVAGRGVLDNASVRMLQVVRVAGAVRIPRIGRLHRVESRNEAGERERKTSDYTNSSDPYLLHDTPCCRARSNSECIELAFITVSQEKGYRTPRQESSSVPEADAPAHEEVAFATLLRR
jgi:hypothetical protein